MKHTGVFPFTKQVAEAEGNKSPVKSCKAKHQGSASQVTHSKPKRAHFRGLGFCLARFIQVPQSLGLPLLSVLMEKGHPGSPPLLITWC